MDLTYVGEIDLTIEVVDITIVSVYSYSSLKQRVPNSLLMIGVLHISISCMLSTCYAFLKLNYVMIVLKTSYFMEMYFDQLHVAHAVVHLDMIYFHLKL